MFSRSFLILICSVLLCSCSKEEETASPAIPQDASATKLSTAPSPTHDLIKVESLSAPASGVTPNVSASTAKPELPPILVAFLKRYPAYHLLYPSDLSEDDAKALTSHELEPFVIADTNQDKNDDVAAIIVRNKKFYAVILQTVEPRISATTHWLLRDSTAPIIGIVVKNGYVTPAFCFGCDTNFSFAWTGSEYNVHIILKGDDACVTGDSDIFTLPDERSKLVYTTTKLEEATVLAVGPRNEGYFWHEVRLDNGTTGYALNSTFIFEPGLCE